MSPKRLLVQGLDLLAAKHGQACIRTGADPIINAKMPLLKRAAMQLERSSI